MVACHSLQITNENSWPCEEGLILDPMSVRSGLASIVQGNADVLRSMLGLRDDDEEVCSESGLVTKLLEVMGVNSLNAEVGTKVHRQLREGLEI